MGVQLWKAILYYDSDFHVVNNYKSKLVELIHNCIIVMLTVALMSGKP